MTASGVRAVAVSGCLVLVALTVTVCGGKPTAPLKKPSVATSAKEAGGMEVLIAAAKKEGRLNAVAFPREWASYGALIDGFEKKYGIKVKVENPQGTSQDEIDAVKSRRGRKNAPDVLDIGRSFAQAAARDGLLAQYEVAAYDKIPKTQKDPRAHWYNDYGGYISIGCNTKRVEKCPSTFADLLKPQYKGKVSLNGVPTKSGSAFAGVYAAALANKGSFDDIQPGIDFFAELKKSGNYNPVESTPVTVESGETPISIDWDFNNLGFADRFRGKDMSWKVAIPFDGSFAQYYSQAINKDAPHPAAARLWQEYLFSPEGQNLRLRDYARPVLMDAMDKDGTLDKDAAARLPTVEGTPAFPTQAQVNRARETTARGWDEAVSG